MRVGDGVAPWIARVDGDIGLDVAHRAPCNKPLMSRRQVLQLRCQGHVKQTMWTWVAGIGEGVATLGLLVSCRDPCIEQNVDQGGECCLATGDSLLRGAV